MRIFKDSHGRDWKIELNVGTIKLVKSLCGVDLMDLDGGKLAMQLANDPFKLCDVLYCLCKAEADARGVSDEQFGHGLAGDAIDDATTALFEELVSFFPSRKRPALTMALDRMKRIQERAMEVAVQALSGPELDRKIEEALGSFGKSLTDALQSPVSTQPA